jgi:PBP1b-binding outer membrane lipoprotein LpoB
MHVSNHAKLKFKSSINGKSPMKKILLISLSALLLPACADKNNYEQAVLEQMQKEQDIKDYKITPEYMTKCVVDTTSQNMPGIFAFDPKRLMAYRNYTKMLTLTNSADPKKTLEELRTDFGSAKDLADAHTNYTESLMECYSAVISESEGEAKEQKEEKEEK